MEPAPSISPEGFFTGVRPGPVIVGVLVDWILTIFSMILVSAYYLDPGVWEADDQEFEAAYNALFLDTEFLVVTFLLGALATVIGAYVGAKRAATLQLKYGLVIALAVGMSTLLLYLIPSDEPSTEMPLWYDVIGWLILLPAGVLGGYIAKLQQNRDSA